MSDRVETLKGLLARVEAATGHDDWEIASGLFAIEHGLPIPFTHEQAAAASPVMCSYTNLNDCIALVEKMLPGCMWDLANHDGREMKPRALIWLPDKTFEVRGSGSTPALALLSALLRVLLSQAEGERS